MSSVTCEFKIIDPYSHLHRYPKFLAINKVWVCENSVDILVNTEIKNYYLLHFEPGNYSYTFGQDYGFGDIKYRNLTGQLLNPYILDKLKASIPGYLNYKTSPKKWDTFAFANNTECSLWLNRGDYYPAIILSN